MRIGYSESEDYPGQFELWQANCQRSLQGRKGQAALRELETALLALPVKRLIAEEVENADGEVCTIGALAKFRGLITDEMKAQGEYDMEGVGVKLGIPRMVAWKIVEVTDIQLPDSFHYYNTPVSPEYRYQKVLAWVQSQIQSADSGVA